MAVSYLTQKMKGYSMLGSLVTNPSDLEITSFLKATKLFVFKVTNELKTYSGDILSMIRGKKHLKKSDIIVCRSRTS